jgi:hypothetical protein
MLVLGFFIRSYPFLFRFGAIYVIFLAVLLSWIVIPNPRLHGSTTHTCV